MLWLVNSLQDMPGAISLFDKYLKRILYAFIKSPTCWNTAQVVNEGTFPHRVMSDASWRWDVGNKLYFTCISFLFLTQNIHSPASLILWLGICVWKSSCSLHRILWAPHRAQQCQLSGLVQKGQLRAQWVPVGAFAGNWPLLLCFGRWGASSRDPFWPTTPPQQLPQPSCSLRYVLSQLLGSKLRLWHREITDFCVGTLGVFCLLLYYIILLISTNDTF